MRNQSSPTSMAARSPYLLRKRGQKSAKVKFNLWVNKKVPPQPHRYENRKAMFYDENTYPLDIEYDDDIDFYLFGTYPIPEEHEREDVQQLMEQVREQHRWEKQSRRNAKTRGML